MIFLLLSLCSLAYTTKLLDRNLVYRSPFQDLPEVIFDHYQYTFLKTKCYRSFLGIRTPYILNLSGMRKDNLGMQHPSMTSITQLFTAVTSVMCMRMANSLSSCSPHSLESIHLDRRRDLHTFRCVSETD